MYFNPCANAVFYRGPLSKDVNRIILLHAFSVVRYERTQHGFSFLYGLLLTHTHTLTYTHSQLHTLTHTHTPEIGF